MGTRALGAATVLDTTGSAGQPAREWAEAIGARSGPLSTLGPGA